MTQTDFDIASVFATKTRQEQDNLIQLLNQQYLRDRGLSRMTLLVNEDGPIQIFSVVDPQKLIAAYPEHKDFFERTIKTANDPDLLKNATPFDMD